LNAIVLTTINVPRVLENYIDICRKYEHKDVVFIVVGDRKSPPETSSYLDSLQGYDIIYLDVPKQEEWLKKIPAFRDFLPYDSVQRRNVGYLYAAEVGADVMISIDDDNIPLPEYDYIGEHSIVGKTVECNAVSSSTGWFNTCSLLETDPPRGFYHRGFPVSKRWLPEELSYRNEKKRVVVNVGLWRGDPDVDTITRLEEPFSVRGVKDPQARLILARGTMSPFNSQNTAFSMDLIPCLYLISFRAGTKNDIFCGNNNFRYDDIWMSYFAEIIIDHMGDAVCIGPPHVEQQRNIHNYLIDLRKELGPMEMTDKLVDILPSIELSEKSYSGAYQELIEQIHSKVICGDWFDEKQRALLKQMTEGMRLWADAVSRVRVT